MSRPSGKADRGVIAVRYAVLMKVHYWDGFTERRLRHLIRKVVTGDVHVFVDETPGAVGEISHDRVTRVTERDMERLGVLMHPRGGILSGITPTTLYTISL